MRAHPNDIHAHRCSHELLNICTAPSRRCRQNPVHPASLLPAMLQRDFSWTTKVRAQTYRTRSVCTSAGQRLAALANVSRRQCVISRAAPEPAIARRYLRRCNRLGKVISISVDFVGVVPLWCDHQAMSRHRTMFPAPLRPPRLPPDRAPRCRVRRRVGVTHR